MAMQKKRVVVIGGGVGGSQVAKKLEQDANVTLIDPYGSHCLLELSCVPILAHKIFAPLM